MSIEPAMNAQDAAGSGAEEQQPRLDFVYRGWHFRYGAQRTGPGVYRPVVVCLGKGPGTEEAMLPSDTDEAAYATEAEALRHAQQQAVRWVHDRTGDGQGQL